MSGDGPGRRVSKKIKPEIEIYRPGSGPLRRSSAFAGVGPHGDINTAVKNDDSSLSASSTSKSIEKKVRAKKPQQELYIPKQVAERLKKCESHFSQSDLSSKDLKERRNSRVDLHKGNSRYMRQGSEPRTPSRHPLDRVVHDSPPGRRSRDWRSVEPVASYVDKKTEAQEKISSSRQSLKTDTLERFKQVNHRKLIPQESVGDWDGNSLMFTSQIQKKEDNNEQPLPQLPAPQGVSRSFQSPVTARGRSRRIKAVELTVTPGSSIGSVQQLETLPNPCIDASQSTRLPPSVMTSDTTKDDVNPPVLDWSEEVEKEIARLTLEESLVLSSSVRTGESNSRSSSCGRRKHRNRRTQSKDRYHNRKKSEDQTLIHQCPQSLISEEYEHQCNDKCSRTCCAQLLYNKTSSDLSCTVSKVNINPSKYCCDAPDSLYSLDSPGSSSSERNCFSDLTNTIPYGEQSSLQNEATERDGEKACHEEGQSTSKRLLNEKPVIDDDKLHSSNQNVEKSPSTKTQKVLLFEEEEKRLSENMGKNSNRGGIIVLSPELSRISYLDSSRPPSVDPLDAKPTLPVESDGFKQMPSISSAGPMAEQQVITAQRHLFDPTNPNQPIPVMTSGSRSARSDSSYQSSDSPYQSSASTFLDSYVPHAKYFEHIVSFWNSLGDSPPPWLDPNGESSAMNCPQLLMDTESAIRELLWYISQGCMRQHWKYIFSLRKEVGNLLRKFLMTDLKFCEKQNVEKYIWTLTTHKIIEKLRELMNSDQMNKNEYKSRMMELIETDSEFLEKLIEDLERVYHFRYENYMTTPPISARSLGYTGLALVSVQKLLLFLGDLARYKEEVNESSNYGRSRQWYMKAQLLNPRNGLPYNQLAVIAVLARKKLDAVYYYMRSLMASNPIFTARENLMLLFDEARRKYEHMEKKRQEEHPSIDDMKEKESIRGLQREFWIHPQEGVPCLHITTSTVPERLRGIYLQEEELRHMSSMELNKRFVVSYINVHGKLFSKVGMETFRGAAVCMLLEFRALLQQRPLPLNVFRFLQLLALNMFSIQNTQLRGRSTDSSYRSALQEHALIVALQMFSLILERCNTLLKEQLDSHPDGSCPRYIVPEDMQTLLPAVKVWCDWLLCNVQIWNPTPSCADYKVGPPEDVWERFATLINLLELLKIPYNIVQKNAELGYDPVYLPEDKSLCDFAPLVFHADKPSYAKDDDMEVAYVILRIRKILFFGTVFLCGIERPVLKLHHLVDGRSEYVSVSLSEERMLEPASDIRLESFSEDEEEVAVSDAEANRRHNILYEALNSEGGETLTLLRRRAELERDLERHKIIVQEVLRNSQVNIEMDVKPRILIPDTNTFIDHLDSLKKILEMKNSIENYYTFGVPLVVFRELEGLSLGGKTVDTPHDKMDHMSVVADAAREALSFLRSKHPGIRCYTTRGTKLNVASCVMNEDNDEFTCNDDRILATAVSIIADANEPSFSDESTRPKRVFRNVVLLTDDRCLRLKAMTKLVPTRDVPDFVKWAGLN